MNDNEFKIRITHREEPGQYTWLALPTSAEAIHKALESINALPGRELPAPYFISGALVPIDELQAVLRQSDRIDDINELAARVVGLSEFERETVAAALRVDAYPTVNDVYDLTLNVDYYCLIPEAGNDTQLGRYYLYQSGMVDMPEEWKAGIDAHDFGAHIREQEKGHFTPHGYLIKSGDEWQAHKGREHGPELSGSKQPPAKEKPHKEKKHGGPER